MFVSFAKLRAARGLFLNQRTLLAVYVIIALAASIQSVIIGTHGCGPYVYTDYNNYVIYRQSFFHLVEGKNLYACFPAEQWDQFKYSPAFALFMSTLAYLPDTVGLCLWNLLNVLAFFLAIRLLPMKKDQMFLLLWFASLELLTAIQNAQSNGLMAGLLIGAYACMERKKIFVAALCVVAATFIKLYGGIGFWLFLFYPGKLRAACYTAFWILLFFASPLVATPFHVLLWQYSNWIDSLKSDQSFHYGLSVMGLVHSWFGVNAGKGAISITGLVLLLLPLLRWRRYHDGYYRLSMLALLLIGVVIFNHMAESPTYIIAVAGAGVWYFYRPALSRHGPIQSWRKILIASVFVLTSVSSTDIFPRHVIDDFFLPYAVKALPCILVWCTMWFEVMTMKRHSVVG